MDMLTGAFLGLLKEAKPRWVKEIIKHEVAGRYGDAGRLAAKMRHAKPRRVGIAGVGADKTTHVLVGDVPGVPKSTSIVAGKVTDVRDAGEYSDTARKVLEEAAEVERRVGKRRHATTYGRYEKDGLGVELQEYLPIGSKRVADRLRVAKDAPSIRPEGSVVDVLINEDNVRRRPHGRYKVIDGRPADGDYRTTAWELGDRTEITEGRALRDVLSKLRQRELSSVG